MMTQTEEKITFASMPQDAQIKSALVPCMLPLFVLGVVSLAAGSILALVASIKMHAPGVLSGFEIFSYGRIRAAHSILFTFGFVVPMALCVSYWILAHLGKVLPAGRPVIFLGTVLWTLGLLSGTAGVLCGDLTGFEFYELPRYSAAIFAISFISLSVPAFLTLIRRNVRELYVAHWFILGGLFWTAWILCSGLVLLGTHSLRGVMQSLSSFWLGNNLTVVAAGSFGVAALLYFIPKQSRRPLYSYQLAAFGFWMFFAFGSGSGIPKTAPLPSWISGLSSVCTGLFLLATLSIFINLWMTWQDSKTSQPYTVFFKVSAFFMLIGSAFSTVIALARTGYPLDFTFMPLAAASFWNSGFLGFALLGAFYTMMNEIAPHTGITLRWSKWHFWIALAGVLLIALGHALGGLVQSGKLSGSGNFSEVTRSVVPFMGISTLGQNLFALGNLVLLVCLTRLLLQSGKRQSAAFITWICERRGNR